MTGALRDVVALLATFLLAGVFTGWIFIPERLSGWDRLFLSLALAVPGTLLAAAPGIATHRLAAWNVVAGLLVLGALGAWRAREGLRRSANGVRRVRPPQRPRFSVVLLTCLAGLTTWFAVLAPQGVESTGEGRPNGTIVYYHWGIVGKVVEDGGLPPTLNEWGKPREFPYEYAFSVMHAASTANLAGRSGFVLEERYRIAMAIGALLALFALWRCWLPSWWAWLAAVLTMNVSRVETRLLVYKPEAFAFILVIWSAWLFDRALERRSSRWGALAGLVLATSFLAHPVGSLLVGPLWGGIAFSRALPWLRRSLKTGWRGPERRSLVALLAAIAVFAILFGGLRTAIGTTGQNLSQSPVKGVDQTRVVYNLAYVSANPFAKPRVPECSHPFGVYSTVRPFFSSNAAWFFFDIHKTSSVMLIAGILVLLGGVFLLQSPPRLARWPAPAKRAVATWTFYGIGVYLLALLICAYYSTWVPQRVGPMRLMPYWALIFPGLIAGVCWAGARLCSGLRSRAKQTDPLSARGVDERGLGTGVRLLPAILFAALAMWTFTTITASADRGAPPFEISQPRAGGLAQSALQSYAWMKRHLPRRAVILTNGYIEGALGSLSDRTGLLDGRTPFAQPDPWRNEAIRWLSQSRRFFLHPKGASVPGGAEYVMAARPEINLGGSYFPTDFQALEADPMLHAIKRLQGIVLYRSEGSPSPQRPSGPNGDTSTHGKHSVMPSDIFVIRKVWRSFLNSRGRDAGAAFASQQSC
jgi:hypothetical protein